MILYEALAGAVPFDARHVQRADVQDRAVQSPATFASRAEPRSTTDRAGRAGHGARSRAALPVRGRHDPGTRRLFSGGESAEPPPPTVARPVAASPGFGNPTPAAGLPPPRACPRATPGPLPHADIPKTSSAPAYLIAGLAVLLLGGGAFAAYQKFGGKPAPRQVQRLQRRPRHARPNRSPPADGAGTARTRSAGRRAVSGARARGLGQAGRSRTACEPNARRTRRSRGQAVSREAGHGEAGGACCNSGQAGRSQTLSRFWLLISRAVPAPRRPARVPPLLKPEANFEEKP